MGPSYANLFFQHGNTESRKNLEQKFTFQLGTLYPHGINEHLLFHLFIYKFMPPNFHQLQSSSTHHTPRSSISSDKGLTLKTSTF